MGMKMHHAAFQQPLFVTPQKKIDARYFVDENHLFIMAAAYHGLR